MQTIEMTEISNNKVKQIHCKLTYNDQIRRFIFYGTEFAELRGHIGTLLSLSPGDGFVLKYVDNESDLITITSNEDLILAMDISDKILRLVVETVPGQFPAATVPLGSPSTFDPTSCPPPGGARYFGRGGGRGRGGHHHFHHQGGQYPHYHPQERGPYFTGDKKEKAKMRIQSKIDYFKTTLEQLPADDWRRQNMLMKINRLEGRILRWDAVCEKKLTKQQQKAEKKEKKHEHKKLSPGALAQVQTLKTQIATFKPVLYQLKATKKAKKSELELSLQTGQGDKESVWNEILRLKESIHETQKQISSLKDQIHSIAKADSFCG
jgi:hypothetical protein